MVLMVTLKGRAGRYEILSHWASRGSGELYVAREATRGGAGELYALTSLSERDTHRRMHEGLRRELEHYADFLHESFAQHHGVFAHEGGLVLVSDFIRGETLGAVMRAEDLRSSASWAVSLVSTLARTLHVAHTYHDDDLSAGALVHGDVCPASVMVTYDGRLVLIDAGWARAASRVVPERAGLRGHLRYFSPERAAGRDDVGPPADVYSLGAMLYELVANAPVITGKSEADLIAAAMRCDIPRLSSRVECSKALESLVHAALSESPEARPTALELAERLSQLRSARLAAWDLGRELTRVMERHFAGRARALRTLEERWGRAPRRGESTSRAASTSRGSEPVLELRPSAAVRRESIGSRADTPSGRRLVAQAERYVPLAEAAFPPDLALDLAPTDDVAHQGSRDLPRSPRRRASAVGIVFWTLLLSAGVVAIATLPWWAPLLRGWLP
jgi:serine/threonine protein kinase